MLRKTRSARTLCASITAKTDVTHICLANSPRRRNNSVPTRGPGNRHAPQSRPQPPAHTAAPQRASRHPHDVFPPVRRTLQSKHRSPAGAVIDTRQLLRDLLLALLAHVVRVGVKAPVTRLRRKALKQLKQQRRILRPDQTGIQQFAVTRAKSRREMP